MDTFAGELQFVLVAQIRIQIVFKLACKLDSSPGFCCLFSYKLLTNKMPSWDCKNFLEVVHSLFIQVQSTAVGVSDVNSVSKMCTYIKCIS